jgi:hypothetical protein
MPDVSKATMYRQVALLVDNVLIEIDAKNANAGLSKRRYPACSRHGPSSTPKQAEAMTNDDHRRGFGASLATLLAEFDVYIADDEANPTADMVTYRQAALWLSENEKRACMAILSQPSEPLLGNRPAPDRRRHLLATILFPQHAIKINNPDNWPAVDCEDRIRPTER